MRPALPSPKTGVNRDGLPTVSPALPPQRGHSSKPGRLAYGKLKKVYLPNTTSLPQRSRKPVDHTFACWKVVDYRQGDSAKLVHLIDIDQSDR